MAFETLVGLNVVDDEQYRAYRAAMTPILKSFGGGFGYDFRIAEVLKSESDAPMNRVFTIHFPDEDTMNAFFADGAYLEARQKHFLNAVTDVTVIAHYHK